MKHNISDAGNEYGGDIDNHSISSLSPTSQRQRRRKRTKRASFTKDTNNVNNNNNNNNNNNSVSMNDISNSSNNILSSPETKSTLHKLKIDKALAPRNINSPLLPVNIHNTISPIVSKKNNNNNSNIISPIPKINNDDDDDESSFINEPSIIKFNLVDESRQDLEDEQHDLGLRELSISDVNSDSKDDDDDDVEAGDSSSDESDGIQIGNAPEEDDGDNEKKEEIVQPIVQPTVPRKKPAYLEDDEESSFEYDDDSFDEDSVDCRDAAEGLSKNQIPKALSDGEDTDSDEYNIDVDDPKRKIAGFNYAIVSLQEEESIPNSDTSQLYNEDFEEDSLLLEGAPDQNIPDTVFSRARKNLHIGTVPDKLPGREKEIKKLYSTLQSRLMDVNGTGQCIYIAGMPGTGKTSTVKEVIRMMQKEGKGKKGMEFEFAELNCMDLNDPHQLYIALYKKLVKKKIKHKLSVSRAMDLLQNFLAPKNTRKKIFRIVLVDEFDQLLTKHQTVIYHLFDWPRRTKSYLIVIAVANTMNLPDALLPRVKSRLGNFRIPFQSYTTSQISTIMNSRLDDLEAFDDEAIELCAKKVAGFCGDARRALEICRLAAEVAEVEWNEKIAKRKEKAENGGKPFREPPQLVKIQHIETVLEMFMSPTTNIIRECCFVEKNGDKLGSIQADFGNRLRS
ncbi:origin recognition complex subunit 1 [Cavenderia fasciculata]|uniref:Origin recognition complex subunit 1 n=1 Tax=Cavenderia fasciculata TaxID=261658 RepID=F4PZV3_CACFS|nr:origin recognition complex subunit 1 [Cavenderia fasciculata]EGG18867.1 origin recognition complex subunit 1 [Cavenderia fasciculata]|eukprot:XP_004357329.1 origin recognition complex subunit 1 [Cavenderia fasciculata]